MQSTPPSSASPSTSATAAQGKSSGLPSGVIAWYFVIVWGSGYLASKTGMHYAAPFTFLTMRFTLGLLCVGLWALATRPPFPSDWRAIGHIAVAGLLVHAVNLGGSHYAQYLGMSAGVTALILSLQPLATALIMWRYSHEALRGRQWLGVLLGLIGVALVVWHKVDVHAITLPALTAVLISLAAMTLGTLYQRRFCPHVDLRSGALIQFFVCLLLTLPLGWAVEGLRINWGWQVIASVVFLVICGSILAVNALHTLMRRGSAAKVTSLLYLTPIIAVAMEFAFYGVEPDALMITGMVIACVGVAMVNR